MENYKHGGYNKRYNVTKTDGTETDPHADYFVLRIDKDPHALVALEAYANSVRVDNEQLANDLECKIKDIKKWASLGRSN